MGILFSLACALFGTAKDMMSKQVASKVDGTTSTFASFVFALPYYVLFLLLLYWMGEEDFAWSWTFLGLVALRSLSDSCAEWSKMTALSLAEISLVSPFLSLAPLFLLFFSPFLGEDKISFIGMLGVVLVVIGGMLASFRSKTLKSEPPNFKAIGFALLGAFFFAVNACFDRLAVHHASPTLSGFAVTIGAALPFLPHVLRSKKRCRDCMMNFRVFSLRGLFEILFMVSKLYALRYLPVSYVVGIQKSSLLFSIVGGRVFFQDKDFVQRMIGGFLTFAGVLLIIWGILG